MDISLILKIAGIGLLVASATQILSKLGRDEQSTLVILSGIIVVLIMLITQIGDLFDTVMSIFGI